MKKFILALIMCLALAGTAAAVVNVSGKTAADKPTDKTKSDSMKSDTAKTKTAEKSKSAETKAEKK